MFFTSFLKQLYASSYKTLEISIKISDVYKSVMYYLKPNLVTTIFIRNLLSMFFLCQLNLSCEKYLSIGIEGEM